ncbi:MAG TPA: Calx-beta domain-containing protein [Thermoanaerobaculia bacterium]|nr:Calx-beta domain-containing protein [Thermoanaerobaculia bacterium]
MRERSTRRSPMALITLIPLAVLLLGAPVARAANHTVHVGGNAGLNYNPSSLTIAAGDSVTWVNDGGMHNVTADDNSFRCAAGCDGAGGSGDPSTDSWSATRTFSTAGTIGYHCEVHGPLGMRGTITVQGAPPPPPSPGTLRFSAATYSVGEGTANATITVNRVSGSDGAASVSWQSAPGTATSADFTPGTGTLTWADKDSADKTFQVHIINDTLVEPTETVLLSLSGATGAALDNAHKSATLNILDNDGGGGVPAAPTGLAAAGASTSEIDLSWHDVTGETGFRIERKTLGGTYAEIGTVGTNVTTFQDTGLSEATGYSYRIRAENGSGRSPYSNESVAATNATVAPCVASSTVLCLNNGRFAVHVAFVSGSGSGDATTVPLPSAPDSGLFYFFSPTNIEMLIKVLNACTFSTPRYWVFYAATTNVQLVVTVTDSQTGKVKPYFNPLNNTAAPVQDVDAFATCP